VIIARFRTPPRGFTLLEVLVVMLIIGIVLSVAVLSLNGDKHELEDEARRLQALITLTGQEAVLQSKELALQFSDDGYEFQAYDGEKWQPLENDETLRARTLPDDLVLEYRADGDKMTLGIGDDDEKAPPRIYFLSSGEVSPFELTLRRRGGSEAYTLTGDVRGKTELKGPDDAQ
jgi:general secretion pathway protein H